MSVSKPVSKPVVHFVARPHALPHAPRSGRVVVLDVAFANGKDFMTSTLPFIRSLGPRLAMWIDHHDHPAWSEYQGRENFVLVSKLQARACPQLVTPQIVARAGGVDHVVAHADFDGCMSAAKFLRGGTAPYAEADEDGRFSDAPGHGFVCSPRGLRLTKALEQARSDFAETDYVALLIEVAWAQARDEEGVALRDRLTDLATAFDARAVGLTELLVGVTRPHPEVMFLQAPTGLSSGDKKFLLRHMEERARVAVIEQDGGVTIATYDDEEEGLDLGALKGLKGQRGYAWGQVSAAKILPAVVAAVKRRLNS